MWTTLLVLAIALNFEPTRLGLVGLILIRPRPIPQLLAFLAGSFLTSASAGLLILFLLHNFMPTGNHFNGAKVQIAVGALALIIAAILASNFLASRPEGGEAADNALQSPDAISARPGLVGWLSTRAGQLAHGSSPWFAGALGVGIAIPSVDYLALLLLIATSGAPLSIQAGALLTFLSIANVVLLAPIAAYLLAPDRTTTLIEQLRSWVLARRRRDYAVLLAIAGCLLIAVGFRGL